ncbi:hemoglobin [Sinobacterium caligoides]|uniref:Hemoglobin n=1 Tax=Sinobacterium caligoides TaxID=933926 RepID=A0A3N2DKC4_9GAMM|nr:hypothetical protein [Sinobacterium caligoides]ROS00253.1 hemoglobin [Sinobacterium caligoides]
MKSITLFDAVGGESKFIELCEHFYNKVLADPLLAQLFDRPEEDHAGRLAAWFTEVFGGPARHTETRGGFSTMVRSHYGLKITAPQREAWLEYMKQSTTELNWSQQTSDALIGYLNQHSKFSVRDSHAYPKDQPTGKTS